MNIDKLNELRVRIDEVLFYLWDPIEICHESIARGEYSSYVDSLISLVIEENIDGIVRRLSNIEVMSMGLTENRDINILIAKRLINDKNTIIKGQR